MIILMILVANYDNLALLVSSVFMSLVIYLASFAPFHKPVEKDRYRMLDATIVSSFS